MAATARVQHYPHAMPAPKMPALERPGAHVPSATYRIQFGPDFGFEAARRLVPFLRRLGVTHVYSSPILAARSGSTHGYDVTDPLRLNPDLGTAEEFEAFVTDIKRHGMQLILDIVPNHMAADAGNVWWDDVLEEGAESVFARYFDIDWAGAPAGCEGRVVLPVLGAPLAEVLKNGELRLAFDERGFSIRYWQHRFPVCPRLYRSILAHGLPNWEQCLQRHTILHLEGLLAAIGRIPDTPPDARSRLFFKRTTKAHLWDAYRSDPAIRAVVDAGVHAYNHRSGPGKGCNSELLRGLILDQNYVLMHWLSGREQVNYRRFFDINELVGLRLEDDEVFRATHSFILRLVREGKVAGLRLDHIDGLYDPLAYLRRLENSVSSLDAGRQTFIIAEKITIGDETLPDDWPVWGTTGYDFLSIANSVFVDAGNMRRIEEIYSRFTGLRTGYHRLVYEQKKRVIRQLFGSELSRLVSQLQQLAAGDEHAAKCRAEDFAAAVEEVSACLPVYRTYIRSEEVEDRDRRAIESACEAVSFCTWTLPGPASDFLQRVLLLNFPVDLPGPERQEWLAFVMRWQQFTGPVMAKGMEDTACYIHNRLVSLNVVGGRSQPVSVEEFHRFNEDRSRNWPFSFNATSTHDTKRSEDVRARINVISELPDLWDECVARWSGWNRPRKRVVHGSLAPSANDEILLYQVLLGAWPLSEAEVPEFKERLRGFVIKAAREAKTNTNWLCPDPGYEQALLGFVDGILEPSHPFLLDFLRIQAAIALAGATNSLAETVLKVTCPGVPDFYQGTLVWDFSLVDPDNRRPVDFEKRMRLFDELEGASPEELLANWEDGRVKLFTISRALQFRRAHRDLFLAGAYVPLEVRGPAAAHVIAFARRSKADWALVAVPRTVAALSGSSTPLPDPEIWRNTELILPAGASHCWRNEFTGETVLGATLPLAELFGRYPVALLSANAEAGTVAYSACAGAHASCSNA